MVAELQESFMNYRMDVMQQRSGVLQPSCREDWALPYCLDRRRNKPAVEACFLLKWRGHRPCAECPLNLLGHLAIYVRDDVVSRVPCRESALDAALKVQVPIRHEESVIVGVPVHRAEWRLDAFHAWLPLRDGNSA